MEKNLHLDRAIATNWIRNQKAKEDKELCAIEVYILVFFEGDGS